MAIRGKSITLTYTAWDTANNAGKTGDGANHTIQWIKDGVMAAHTGITEVHTTLCPGEYAVTMTAVECNCDFGVLCGKSDTAGIVIIPVRVSFVPGTSDTFVDGEAR